MVVGGGFDGGAFAGGVLEVEEDGGGAGMGGEDLGDVFEVAFAVAGGPEHEFDGAFSVGGGAFGFEFGEFVSGEAAGAGAVVDLDGAFEFDGFSGIEEAGIARGDEGFAPEHDFGGAGEVFEDEDAEGFAGFGGFGVEAADHAGEGVAFAGVGGVEVVDEAEAAVAVGIEDTAEFVERVAGDVESEEFLFVGEAFVFGPFLDGGFVHAHFGGGWRGEVHGIEEGDLAGGAVFLGGRGGGDDLFEAGEHGGAGFSGPIECAGFDEVFEDAFVDDLGVEAGGEVVE